MNFWYFFLRIAPSRPRPALAALYWHLTGRRVRARNLLRIAGADLPFVYDLWINSIEKRRDATAFSEHALEGWEYRPRFSLLLYSSTRTPEGAARKTLHSIEQQVYVDWNLLFVEPNFQAAPHKGLDRPAALIAGRSQASDWALPAAIAAADGDFVVPVKIGDVLSKMALFRMVEALQVHRSASILYGDQDEIDDRGLRRKPWFKPCWNPEMFLALDYLSSAVAIETDCARMAIRNSRSEDLNGFLLAATSGADGGIVHIPHVLTHVPATTLELIRADRIDAVTRHVQPLGAKCGPGLFGTVKVQWPLPAELPLVTIIIPTKDKLELLRPCVEGVLSCTDYENFEVLIVDNGSVEPATIEYLNGLATDARVQVVPYPAPYNFSAINNFAVGLACGSFICLLNNDTEVVHPEWLTEMMRYATRSEIGAVGAKLLYEDGSIQHAGVVVGIGEAAGHAHRMLPADDPGYFCMAHVAQFVSAVTAACLVIEKKKFEAVGGLDADKLAIAFNDVDLCLKLQAKGWQNVYVPHISLLHHESRSRGSDMEAAQIERYRCELKVLQDRWMTKSYVDPLHNPNLDRYSETFVLHV